MACEWSHYPLLLLLTRLALTSSGQTCGRPEGNTYGSFPQDFSWGVSTSAYQIEGAWNQDGKGESIWDRFTHTHPERIADGSNGDVSCDSYHLYLRDIQMLKELGVTHYRFSLSWSRLLPNGTVSYVNQNGVGYYHRLIDQLLTNGIRPMVTIYHWDLPQILQDNGGWAHESIVQKFAEFANFTFATFGDKVKYWITLNEPYRTVISSEDGGKAPGIIDPGVRGYKVAHNLLKAHATAWHLYDDVYRPLQHGTVSITLDIDWYEPKEDKFNDRRAAERAVEMQGGIFAHPIYSSYGDYPDVIKKYVDEKSRMQGLRKSRLPTFDREWIEYIKGTSDHFCLNHYTTYLASSGNDGPSPSMINDVNLTLSNDTSCPEVLGFAGTVVPWGLRKVLDWIMREYNSPEIFLTESGLSDTGNEGLNDTDRILYLQSYMKEALQAIQVDGCKLRSYTIWSLMDNFEWNSGYSAKYGLYQVDFKDPNRTRTAKASAHFYKQVITDWGFPPPQNISN